MVSRGGCPVSLECTAVLLDAILLESQAAASGMAVSPLSLRQCYASALVRSASNFYPPLTTS